MRGVVARQIRLQVYGPDHSPRDRETKVGARLRKAYQNLKKEHYRNR